MNSLKCVFSRFVPNILVLRPCLLHARPIINILMCLTAEYSGFHTPRA